MSKTTKSLLVFLVVFLSTILSLLVAVENHIDPAKIKKEVRLTLLKAFPHSKVKLNKIDYSLGTMVRFYLNEISVNNSGKTILYMDKVTCKTSLLSTIFGGGKIQINIDNPKFDKDIVNHVDQQIIKDNKINLELPDFITRSKIDLGLRNIEISNDVNRLHLKKVLLKNINGQKSLVYEIISKADYNIGSKNLLTDVQVIGEMKPLKNGELKSTLMIDFKNIVVENRTTIPRARARVDLVWKNNKSISGHSELNLTTLGDFNFDFTTDLSEYNLTNIQGSVQNASLPKILKDRFFKLFDYQKSITVIKGDLLYNSNNGNVIPNLELELQKPIRLSLGNIDSDFTFNASMEKDLLKLRMTHNLLDGVVSSDLDVSYNKGKISKVKGNIDITGVSIQRNTINLAKKHLLKNNKVQEVEFSNTKIKKEIELKVTGKNNMIGESKFDVKGEINRDTEGIRLKNLVFESEKGMFSLDLKKKNKDSYELRSQAKNINLKELKPILPFLLPNLSGSLTGDLKGSFSAKQYSFDINLKLKSFIIGLVDLSSPINSFLSKLGRSNYFSADERLNSFEEVFGEFTLYSDGVSIKKAQIKSEKISFLDLKGFVRDDRKSYVSGKLKLKEIIPFKFTGHGHVLNPDLDYTKSKLKR